jgi:citrate synthase
LDGVTLALALRRATTAVRAPLADPDELAVGRLLLPMLAASAAIAARSDAARSAFEQPRVAAILAVALGAEPNRETVRAIDRALVLVADHELNVSAFAARVAASAGTDLMGCLAAAMAVLSGARHGGVSDGLEAMLDAMEIAPDHSAFVAARLSRDAPIPGFGHPLYPAGDPRALPLIELARKGRAPKPLEPRLRALLSLVDELLRRRHPPATVDVGLVALRLRLGLSRGAASVIFAIGRCAGWIAHILEQRQQGALLRPRARYVGSP